MKKQFKVPKFKDEDEERKFWDKVELGDYFDSDDFEQLVFLISSPLRLISIRILDSILNRVKEQANETNVPY